GMERMGERYYTLSLCGTDDGDDRIEGIENYITNDWHAIEIEWKAATAPSANNGYIKLWINDVLVDEISNIDNDTHSIDAIDIGLVSDVNPSTTGSVYFDEFASTNGTHIGLHPQGPALSTPLDLVFADGFESGDLEVWDWADTDGGDLSVTTEAAAVGSYGLQGLLDDGTDLDLYEDEPDNEKHFSARFYFKPNSVQLTSEEGVYIFAANNTGNYWEVACLYLEEAGDYYSLSLCSRNDAGTWLDDMDAILIADTWQAIEVEWKAATAPGANNGYAKLYVGDQLVQSIENIDNDTQSVTEIWMGIAGDDFSADGTVYFDAFESSRGAHIGLDPEGPLTSPPLTRPDFIFADDFETNDLSNWNPTLSTVDGG